MKQLARLEEIANSVSNFPHALALLALGSVGTDRVRLDEYSDLDFFVICENGYKDFFIDNLDWLKSIESIAYAFRNSKDGYKVLFTDNIFCEFAVFDQDELKDIPFSKGKLIWNRSDFSKELCTETIKHKQRHDKDFLIGEALTNLYIGLGRFHRGEKLSAFNFVQSYAFANVLELMTYLEEPQNDLEDSFSLSRRFEQRYIENSKQLSSMLSGYDNTLKAAEAILTFLDSHFEINQFIKARIIELITKK